MTDEEPLHVACARALGWTDIQWTTAQGAWGRHPSGEGGHDRKGYQQIPRYGEDAPDGWAWTGPLAGEYGFSLDFDDEDRTWLVRPVMRLYDDAGYIVCGEAPSAPEAIAVLVVKLHELGKLVRA